MSNDDDDRLARYTALDGRRARVKKESELRANYLTTSS